MNRNKPPACAYLADMDLDPVIDGGVVSSDQHPPSIPSPLDEGTSLSFAAFGTTSFVPTPMNEDVFFDVYQTGVIPTALSSISELSPVCLLSISECYNSILDSGCTNHIIQDHSLFWTYHTSLAVPVKMANCGVLETVAKVTLSFMSSVVHNLLSLSSKTVSMPPLLPSISSQLVQCRNDACTFTLMKISPLFTSPLTIPSLLG